MYNYRYYVKNGVKWVQENNHHEFLSFFFSCLSRVCSFQHMLKGALHENNLYIKKKKTDIFISVISLYPQYSKEALGMG